MSNKRLFFALWPSDRQRDQLRDLISPVAKLIEGSAIFRGKWHLTLAYIGDFPENLIPDLQQTASEIAVEPFRLRFDRIEYWPRPKLACLVGATNPPELQRLVAALNSTIIEFGDLPEERAFRPHITVVRRARAFETQRLAQPVAMEWSDFELVESISQPGGVMYRPLKQ